jgi:hypothetical protein
MGMKFRSLDFHTGRLERLPRLGRWNAHCLLPAGGDDSDDPIVGNVLKARERRRQALAEYEMASTELDWWLEGAKLAGISELQVDVTHENSVPDDLFPPVRYFEETGERPTLRQAIFAELATTPRAEVSVADLTDRLMHREWISGYAAQKRVSDLAGVMHGDEQLQRVGRGIYRVHPKLAMVIDQQTAADIRIRSELPPTASPPPAAG